MIQITIYQPARIVLPVWLLLLLLTACKKKENTTVPVVTISSISKNRLQIGDTLFIKGTNFSTTPATNLVSVASISFPVINASSGELSVMVPKGAQSGMLSIGFKGGQATQFDQPITIAGFLQPSILSITPASAYEGDTLIVTGKNFGTPYDQNSILFNGTYAGKIINATPTELRVVVPGLSNTGPVQVTSGGLASTPVQFTINKVNPLEDGSLYWMTPTYSITDPGDRDFPGKLTGANFNKGLANSGLPQSNVLYSVDKPLFAPNTIWWRNTAYYPEGPRLPYYAIDNFVVNDLQRNAYYLTSSAYPFPAQYSLMKLSDAGAYAVPVAIWSKTFDAPGQYTKFYPVPSKPTIFRLVHYSPIQQLAMDGNTIYIKMGMSDDYYTGDVSLSTPSLTLQRHVFGDSSAYNQQFGKDYIFYISVGSRGYPYTPTDVLGVRYIRRGGTVIETIQLDLSDPATSIVCIMTSPSHGNNLLIVTRSSDYAGNALNTIYKFNADTRVLSVLYNADNWSDATSSIPAKTVQSGNTGFIWLGSHIYYACTKVPGQYTALRRINDNGITPKIYTVYGRMESLTSTQALKFSLFTGK
jgi:hypothetical protein